MADTKTYSAEEVKLSLAGREIDSGFGDGDFVKIEMMSPQWTTKVGANGEAVRCKTADKRAKVTIILMATSAGNDILAQLLALDVGNPNGAGVGAFKLIDLNGRTLAEAPHAWVAAHPSVAFGREVGTREWVLECGQMDLFVGGSAALPAA
jgi:hypothetical protein